MHKYKCKCIYGTSTHCPNNLLTRNILFIPEGHSDMLTEDSECNVDF